MALEDRVERLTNALERMLDQGSFSNGQRQGGVGGTSGGSTDNAGRLTRGTNDLLSSGANLVKGNYNLLSAVGDVTKVLGIFGGVGQAVAGITGKVASELVEMNQNLMMSSKFGINFSQNLGMFTETLGAAGIGQQQWIRLLESNSRYLAGSGTTAQQAANLFLDASTQLMNEPGVLAARIAGIGVEEFQDQLLISTNLLKFQGLESERVQQLLIQTTQQTTIELDNMARITGRSRQEIQKGIDKQLQSDTMAIAKMAMDEKELAMLNASLPVMTQYGSVMGDLFTEISANRGNIVSKEGGAQAAALEVLAPGIVSTMRQLAEETDPLRRKELEERVMYEMSRGAANKENLRALTALARSGDETARNILKTVREGEAMLGAGSQFIKQSDGTFASFQKNLGEITARAKTERDTLEGEQPPGAQLSQVINAAEAATKAISAGLSMGIREVADKAGEQLAQNKLQADYLKILTIQKFDPANLEKMLEGVGISREDLGNRANAPNIPGMPWTRENPLPVREMDPRTREVGSIGANDGVPRADKWFENFGAGTKLFTHGEEAILRPQDVPAFIKDMIAQDPGLLAGLQGNLRNGATENSPQVAIQRAMQQFTSSINVPATVSPVTSSTTASGTMIGDSKTTTDLHTALEKLNTKMDKLITAVEDSGNANVKAVKSRTNLIA